MDRLIAWSIRHRVVVIVATLVLTGWGAYETLRMPVDVFPDLTAPTVTIVTEAHGLAPQEVESLVTFPVETAVNGATDVRRVRSASGIGLSVVWVEFDWGVDMRVARQVVAERLQLAAGQLPEDIGPPTLAPVSSVMGEILFVALTGDETQPPMAVREAADWTVRRRLLAVPGVAQVIPIGGDAKQFQVQVDPDRLRRHGVTLEQVVAALEASSANSTGGFLIEGAQESLIRAVGRLTSREDVEQVVVALTGGVPVTVGQVATVVIGPGLERGTGSANARPAVVLGITKQPGANTLALTEALDAELASLAKALPKGITLERDLFRQSDFIETAVSNVSHALRDGAILVAVILFVFLLNARATLISLAALPVSLIVAVLTLRAMDASLNTMTLGGLTIAIGSLVDDAIIDVENVVRRLRDNARRAPEQRLPVLEVVYEASREIRSSIVFATFIVMLVFLPLFFLSGVEGRLLFPLGLAYLVAIFASLVVALTLTPALCAWLLPRTAAGRHEDGAVVRGLKAAYRPVLRGALRHGWAVAALVAGLVGLAAWLGPRLGTTFLPEFNEGALTVSVVTVPGTSLDKSDAIGRRVEEILLAFPEVAATDRRTGRAELDEHAQDVNASEIDVRLHPLTRSREAFLADLRAELATVSGAVVTLGQPISHRIDHMLSGTRAAIAIKLFGDDLFVLRALGRQIEAVAQQVPGAVDVSLEQQVDIPQLSVDFDRQAVARFGLRTGALAELIEVAHAGLAATRVYAGDRSWPVVVRLADEARADLDRVRATLVATPAGPTVPLSLLAEVRRDAGPNLVTRENNQRKIVVMANVAERDLGSVVAELRQRIGDQVELPEGYWLDYGGQFESQSEATRTLSVLGAVVVVGILLLLFAAFGSLRNALMVMVNLPLALIGGVAAVAMGDAVLSIGSLVGFVTLFGIATRNGLMMVSHFEHLRTVEGASLAEAVERGSLERLSPILMTALGSALALVPLVLAGHAPGNEIQAPMGVVILGGLVSSTLLNMLVVPVLYARLAARDPRAASPAEDAQPPVAPVTVASGA